MFDHRTCRAGTVWWVVAVFCFSIAPASAKPDTKAPPDRPSLVIIFTDDQGYADVGCFGATGFETPNLDRMAAEGMRFTDFYSAAPSCTPARAALMTGCYPQRVSMPHPQHRLRRIRHIDVVCFQGQALALLDARAQQQAEEHIRRGVGVFALAQSGGGGQRGIHLGI